MFSCIACLRRALRLLSFDTAVIPTDPAQLQRSLHVRYQRRVATASHTSRRGHATFESLAKGHHKRLLRKALQDHHAKGSRESRPSLPPPNARRKGPGALTKGEIKDALARHRNRENNLVIKDDADDGKMQSRLKKEIQSWHSDPLQLAKQVQNKLSIPDFRGALNLVRASEGIVVKNVVSWNHLTDFCMAQGDPDNAWKVYNEMKKRGHRPDAHTYTIMLRGLSANARKKNSAERAVSIYNSMFAPNSAVTPNTIHTNAALNVCARTRDMDSMWAIAGKMPVRGAGCPDRWTFTTILNAIREDATAKVAELLANPNAGLVSGQSVTERQDQIFDEALKDARKLWADVSFRWRRADLIIDETLVCAMGRLILGCGTRKDFQEVFDLVEQTMNVRLKERITFNEASSVLQGGVPGMGDSVSTQIIELDANEQSIEHGNQTNLPLAESVIYAQPSNNTLGMLAEAAMGSKEWQYGKSYWHLLTTPNGPYKIKPDAGNLIAYLRLLRISRSSKVAVDLLSQNWPDAVAEKIYRRATFVIAMSTCMRDKNNPSAFENADRLLLLMQEKLEEQSLRMYNSEEVEAQLNHKELRAKRREAFNNLDDSTFGEEDAQADLQRSKSSVESLHVDPKALRIYLDLALVTTSGWNEGLTSRTYIPHNGAVNQKDKFERDIKMNNTLRALRRIDSQLPLISRLARLKVEEAEMHSIPRPQLKSHGRLGRTTIVHPYTSNVGERLEDLIDLLRSIVGAYDKVIMMAERFEDEDLPRLDEKMIRKFKDNKRAVAGFLSRTKDEVARVSAKKYGFAQFRNRADDEPDQDEDEWDNIDEDNKPGTALDAESKARSNVKSTPDRQERLITRRLRQVYEDTDRNLDRARSLSRRQKTERRNGIAQRMARRNLASKDIGILNEHLQTEKRESVESRMRERAFGINTNPNHQNDINQSAISSVDEKHTAKEELDYTPL